MDYEGQICRAPMERSSFMLPVMVGCSYNQCKFCDLFRHLKFRVLPLEEVEKELQRVKDAGGNPKKVFLGDGNAFALPTEHLMKILDLIHRYFPDCDTINMDATVTSIRKKSDEELKTLYDAGVRHLYLGIESGLNDVLVFMNKDHTIDEAYEAIERLHKVGLIYDAHIMTGVAGEGRGEENARALAKFLNETKPAHIVNFSMFLGKNVPLFDEIQNGNFIPSPELDNLKEDRLLVSLLEIDALYDGFHDFIEKRVKGHLPNDKEKMLAKFDAIIEEQAKMPTIYSMVGGQCPNLYKEDGITPVWDMKRECS